MATRSTITVRTNETTRKSIYSHWDGYIEHNGLILFNHYNSLRKAKKLVRGGSISSLGKKIKTKKEHSFEKPQENVTVYYHRDRGEGWESVKPLVLSNTDKIDVEDYNYYFNGEKWLVDGMCLETILRKRKLI